MCLANIFLISFITKFLSSPKFVESILIFTRNIINSISNFTKIWKFSFYFHKKPVYFKFCVNRNLECQISFLPKINFSYSHFHNYFEIRFCFHFHFHKNSVFIKMFIIILNFYLKTNFLCFHLHKYLKNQILFSQKQFFSTSIFTKFRSS